LLNDSHYWLRAVVELNSLGVKLKAPKHQDQHCSLSCSEPPFKLQIHHLVSAERFRRRTSGISDLRSAHLREGSLDLAGFSTQAAASSWTEVANIQSSQLQTHCSVNFLFRH
jgi:hypothetical protein